MRLADKGYLSIPWELKKIHPTIYLLTFDSQYDLAMTFLRYQEFYECPNPQFRGQAFTILDFMEWYSKENDNKFTYPADWSGFNIPHWVLKNIPYRPDINKYDLIMDEIYTTCSRSVRPNQKWYLLGCVKGDEETLDHELAHAFYYIDEDYKFGQDSLLAEHSRSIEIINKWLIEEGYDESVLKDEAQAYLSTGLIDETRSLMKQKRVPFKSVEKTFSNAFKHWKENSMIER